MGHSHSSQSRRNRHSAIVDNAAPPAYTPSGAPPAPEKSSSKGQGQSLDAGSSKYEAEDALQILSKFDTVIVVDDSNSMYGALWNEARNALAPLAEMAARYDVNGLDLHFLNSKQVGANLRTSKSVQDLFDTVHTSSGTPIGDKLEELLNAYIGKLERAYDTGDEAAKQAIRPVNYIVLTDGAPTDDPESVIVAAARRLDAKHFPLSQVGIQFVQIGSYKPATAYLQELDDGLSHHGIRDMVDTTPYNGELTAEKLTKILIGGINRRVDKKGGASVMV